MLDSGSDFHAYKTSLPSTEVDGCLGMPFGAVKRSNHIHRQLLCQYQAAVCEASGD